MEAYRNNTQIYEIKNCEKQNKNDMIEISTMAKHKSTTYQFGDGQL